MKKFLILLLFVLFSFYLLYIIFSPFVNFGKIQTEQSKVIKQIQSGMY